MLSTTILSFLLKHFQLEFILCMSTYHHSIPLKINIDFFLFATPTNWPCKVLILPDVLHSWPIISHKSTKSSRTSDRWLSYCLLIARVYLLIIFPSGQETFLVEGWIRSFFFLFQQTFCCVSVCLIFSLSNYACTRFLLCS